MAKASAKTAPLPVQEEPQVVHRPEDLIERLETTIVELKRRIAAYNKFTSVYSGLMKGQPAGMPIFEFKASINGVSGVLTVNQDMREFNEAFPEQTIGVISMFANVQARALASEIDELVAITEQFGVLINTLLPDRAKLKPVKQPRGKISHAHVLPHVEEVEEGEEEDDDGEQE